MYKFLFITTLSILWLGCSQAEHSEVPASVRAVFEVHHESDAIDALVTDLLASNDKTEEAWGSYLLSREIVRKGVNFEALTYLERAEVLFRATDNKEGIKRILLLKAHAYWSLGAGEEILAISEETMRLRAGNLKGWATAAGNYTTYLLDYGRYEEVLTYSDSVLAICRQVDGGINPSEAYAVRAEALQKLGRDSIAVDTLITLALELIDGTIPDVDKKNIYFRALNLNALDQPALARCIRFAKGKEFWSLEAKSREKFTDYELLGETKEMALKAEVEANKRALAEVDEGQSKFLAFELARGQTEIYGYQREARMRKIALSVTVILFVLLLIGIVVNYRSRIMAARAKLSQQEAELALENYKNTIRPHFLFNQLNNVSAFLNQELIEQAQEYLSDLGQFLRSLLEEQDDQTIELGSVKKQLHAYIALQKKGSYAHVAVTIDIPKELRKVRIPTGLLQPLVENSFKYAGHEESKSPSIRVEAHLSEENVLTLKVEDSGYGEYTRQGGTGHGLQLIKDRMAFNKSRSKMPKSWTLTTSFKKEKGTVIMTMPLQE
jgi:two-component sensor histidine kinase